MLLLYENGKKICLLIFFSGLSRKKREISLPLGYGTAQDGRPRVVGP